MHTHLAHGTNMWFCDNNNVFWADACGGLLVKVRSGRGGGETG